MKNLTLALLIPLAACTSDSLLEDARFATGSRTMVASSDYQSLYAVNVDEGTLAKVTDGQKAGEIEVGALPARVARAGSRIFITLQGERGVAIVEDGPTGLNLVDVIEVGSEPYGVVASEDGSRVYVAVSLDDQVVAIDAATGTITDRWAVSGQPRWLALHPEGGTLYAGSFRTPTVAVIDTRSSDDGGGVVDVIELPGTTRTTPEGVIDLTSRITGDLAVDANGGFLVVPALYVDNISREDVPVGANPTALYYANPKPGLGRFNTSLVQVPLGTDLLGTGTGLPNGDATPIFVASFRDEVFGTITVRSTINSVSISPDGVHYAASMEGSNAVVMVGALPYNGIGDTGVWVAPLPSEDPRLHGFADHPHVTMDTAAGPRGVAYLDEHEATVHSFLDYGTQSLDMRRGMDLLQNRGKDGLQDLSHIGDPVAPVILVDEPAMSLDARLGRAAFYGAANTDMASSGSGVSCSTCHVEGRDDGLTWQLGDHARQTPSLAGRVSDTHPVTWTGAIASVADEARETSTVRMGGVRLNDVDYARIAAFVDWTPVPDHSLRDGLDPLVAQGQAIFEREDVGCASCHNGPAYTDNQFHDMYGLVGVNTPTLRGIIASAPYLHDGSALTLRQVLENSRAGGMGDTSMLSPTEMDALEAYLKSL